jgi:serine/threonine protein kinase
VIDDQTPSFENLLAEIWEHRDAGRPIDLEQYARDYPHLADRLREHFAQKDWFEDYGDLLTNPDRTDIFQDQTPTPTMLDSVQEGTVLAEKYRLLQKIADGGMGTVWLAQQDAPVKRRVAIKLIKQGMDSRQVLLRFEAERQALAMMDHPNIAKVFDAGLTADGRPFFAMELVIGVPITEYCDANRLTTHQRLELFIPVCQAIQHAHQKGVIHRDIKPSNVLIALYDGKAVPKVIDFGLAKATGQALTEQTLSTALGAILGTPQYMSPEQATLNNLDIDTRSDVYSLGVLLYELLTGSPPFAKKELEKKGLLEILRVVREEEPPKPSEKLSTAEAKASISAYRSTEPKALTKLLRHELDWVLLKTLEKDRSRRYESANGLALDIQRYLADEIVEARPPSRSYRLRKFVNRQKRTVTAAAAVFIALLGGVVGTSLGLLEAKRGRDDAVEARRKEKIRADGESEAKSEKVKALDLAYMQLYKSGMGLLGRLAEDRSYEAASDLLAKLTPAKTGGRDLREFEWYYWENQTRNPIRRISVDLPFAANIFSMRISPDGARCSLYHSGGIAGTPGYMVIDSTTGKQLSSWKFSQEQAEAFGKMSDISPDCTRLAVIDRNGRLTVWDLDQRKRLFQVQSTPDSIVKYAHSGKTFLANTADSVLATWDSATGQRLALLAGHTASGSGIFRWNSEISSDGSRVIVSGKGSEKFEARKECKVLDVSSGLVKFSPITFGKCSHVAYRPDGLQVAAFCNDAGETGPGKRLPNELLLWNLDSDRPIVSLTPGFLTHTLCYSPDSSKLIALGTYWEDSLPKRSIPQMHNELRVWDTATGIEKIYPFPSTGNFDVWAMAFSPNGRYVFAQGDQSSLLVYDLMQMPSHQLEHFRFHRADCPYPACLK